MISSAERVQGPAAPPLRIPRLGISMGWTLGGYGVYMLCQWAMLVVVARLGSPEQVGEFALGVAIAAPVILFSNLGLRRIQVTDAGERFSFADCLGLRLLTNALALVVIAAVAVAAAYPRAMVIVILGMGLAKAVEATSDVAYGMLQVGERMDQIAHSLVLRGVGGVLGLAVGLGLSGSVAWGLLGMTAFWTGVLLLHDLPAASRVREAWGFPGGGRPRWEFPVLARLSWTSLPLGIVNTLGALMASIPCLFIERTLGTSELGIYTVLAYSYAASHRVASAMGEAASARLARHYAAGDRADFLRITSKLIALAGGFTLTGLLTAAVLGRPLLRLTYGPLYAEQATLLVGFMAVAVLGGMGVVLDYAMTAMRRFTAQPFIYAGAALLYAGLLTRFVPLQGLAGAVAALAVVCVVQGTVTLWVVLRSMRAFPVGLPKTRWVTT